jgi:regulator of RNase E activity RraB
MEWLPLILVALAGFVAFRIFTSVREARRQREESWDARLIERLRSAGSDPFKAHEVLFFFALPTEQACAAVSASLEPQGYRLDVRPLEDQGHAFSLNAVRTMRLNASDIRATGRMLEALATAHGGRYDGWTVQGIRRMENEADDPALKNGSSFERTRARLRKRSGMYRN